MALMQRTIKKAWNLSIKRLKELNIPINYMDDELLSEAAAILYDGPWIAERWADLSDFITSHPESVFQVTEQVLRSGDSAEYNAASLFKAMHRLQTIKLEVKKQLNNAVLAMPTAGGTWTREQVRSNPISTNSDMGRYTNHCNLLDLCAAALPAGEAAPNTPFGITLFSLAENEHYLLGTGHLWENKKLAPKMSSEPNTDTTLIAVCGLHMRGFPLEQEMHQHGARFIRENKTAANYQLVKLATSPSKPGLIQKPSLGSSIDLEIWEMPLHAFGAFAASIPAPLGIGKIKLQDGSEVPGFLCEAYAASNAEDISSLGSWRNIPATTSS